MTHSTPWIARTYKSALSRALRFAMRELRQLQGMERTGEYAMTDAEKRLLEAIEEYNARSVE